jgi:hypothetical protein
MSSSEIDKLSWINIDSSSQIKSVALCSKTEALFIKFPNNSIYRYTPFTMTDYKDFIGSNSMGSYFHTNIKKLTTTKISNG